MRPPEITSRIQRDHLRELLDVESPPQRQRTTARMPAVTLTGLLTLRDDDAPAEPRPVKVRFLGASPLQLENWPRSTIIIASFSATLLLASLLSCLW